MVNKNSFITDLPHPDSIYPLSPGAFENKYEVVVTNPVKDGNTIHFTLKTTQVCLEGNKTFCVTRIYDDFKYLHHCLITQNNTNGIIIPPLPKKPIAEAKGAEIKAKKQLGNNSKQLMSDDFQKECHSLEIYLKHMLKHWKFKTDDQIYSFLTSPEATPRANIKQSLIAKISTSVDESKKSNHRDIDDYFQLQRDWTNKYYILVKTASEEFNNIIGTQKKITSSYGNICTILSCINNLKETNHEAFRRLMMKTSESVENVKHGLEVSNVNDEKTLGYELDLLMQYFESLKSMHNKRTGLLMMYEESNRTLSKAKPHKITEAEELKKIAENELEESTEIARKEIQSFQKQRLDCMRNALTKYSEAKIETAKDIYTLLSNSLTTIAQI